MKRKIDVTVVIPTILATSSEYNRIEDIKRCLNSLANQTFKQFEVLIVDNSPSDNISTSVKELLANLSEKIKIRIIRDPERNLAHVFNTGWQSTSTDIVAYVNDDVEAEPNWLENILDTFTNFDADLVGGPTIAMREQEMFTLHKASRHSHIMRIAARIYESIVLEGRLFAIGVLCESGAYSIGGSLPFSIGLRDPFEVDLLTITNMAVKRSVLQRLEGFDENFLYTHADGDFFIRAKNAGFKLIFNPKAVVKHYLNPSGSTRSAYYRGRDFAYFYLKSVKPKSFRGWLGYILNILYFNFYWLYKAWIERDLRFLKGIRGFIDGFQHYIKTHSSLVIY